MSRVARALTIVAAFLLGGVGGYLLGGVAPSTSTPGAGSVDVGFAQDMSIHHAQAVEMAGLVLDRTTDEAVATLATDILLTQQAQIGQMQGWLDLWDQPKTSTGPRMAWMGMAMDGRMPGMAGPDELQQLARADGADAELLFLELMIDHHRSGVAMADAAVGAASTDVVVRLASAMVSAQAAEIEAMEALADGLTRR